MEYLRNAWYVAAWVHELASDHPESVTILGEPIVLWRSNRQLVAFEDRCVHRGSPLSLGRCEGDKLRCMYHGFLFSRDGAVAEIPGQDSVPPRAQLRTYPVLEKHGWVWVWMGRSEDADPTLIPELVGVDDQHYLMVSGRQDWDTEANLISENLLDFSHLTYVHQQSFGSGSEFAEIQPNWDVLPRGIRYSRWTPSIENPIARADGGR